MNVKMRQLVEREIIAKFVTDFLAKGYRLSVSLERGWDTDEMLLGSKNAEEIIEASMAGDEAHIFVHKDPDCDILVDGSVNSDGWIYLVFGNDGWDVISDYSTNLEEELNGAFEVSNKYQ